MDLGRRLSLGLRAVPLWSLGILGWRLGLGAWPVLGAPVVCSRPRWMVRRPALGCGFRLRRIWLRLWSRLRLGSAGLQRTFLPGISRQWRVFPKRESQQCPHREL